MILPFLGGLRPFNEAPVTYLLVLLNFLVFLLGEVNNKDLGKKWQQLSDSPVFSKIQADLYSQFVLERPETHGPFVKNLASRVDEGDKEARDLLSSLALRDGPFLQEAESLAFKGDQVAVEYWRRQIAQLVPLMDVHPSYILGISQSGKDWGRWLTYQFVHSGVFHFISNMAFFVIFGAALELALGGLGLLVVYLGSGFIGAGIFLLLTEPSAAPLVGASGSIAGVMAFYAFFVGRSPIRYVLLGVPRMVFIAEAGRSIPLLISFVYLPAYVAWVMFFLADLAGYLGAVDELGGVAHAAHLGGQLAGIVVAVTILSFRKYLKPIFQDVYR